MTFALGIVALALAALPAALALANLSILRGTQGRMPSPATLVSILIPARDEERNIAGALDAALVTRDVPVEVLVMDDGSTDRTAEIVRRYAASDPRVRLLEAPLLEPGWTGKVHACHHLSRHALGTYLLFVDADVRLEPHAASVLAGHAQGSGAALVSAVPRQVMGSPGEMLIVPTINLLMLGYLPVAMMRRSPDPGFGAACGQLMLAEAKAYRAAGGHGAIRHLLHDGIQLARLFRTKGLATDLLLGHDLASCRMYGGLREAWAGFAKNAREGMARPVALPIWTLLLGGGHVLPFVLLALAPSWPAAVAALTSLFGRASITTATREPLLSIALHPFAVTVGLIIQWRALLRLGKGRQAGWKGRLYPVG
jgi:hypothetical protein